MPRFLHTMGAVLEGTAADADATSAARRRRQERLGMLARRIAKKYGPAKCLAARALGEEGQFCKQNPEKERRARKKAFDTAPKGV